MVREKLASDSIPIQYGSILTQLDESTRADNNPSHEIVTDCRRVLLVAVSLLPGPVVANQMIRGPLWRAPLPIPASTFVN